MRIARVTNIAIGVLTLVMSFLATWWRYGVEQAVSPSIGLTTAIFSFMAVTLTMSLRRVAPSDGDADGGQGNAGVIWLVLLLLTAAATWELIPAADRPAVGILLALIVGLATGTAVGPGIDLGSDESSRSVVGARVFGETSPRRRRRSGS